MRRMLEELYFGNIDPNVKRVIRDSRYDQAMRVVSENEEKLTLLLEGKENPCSWTLSTHTARSTA